MHPVAGVADYICVDVRIPGQGVLRLFAEFQFIEMLVAEPFPDYLPFPCYLDYGIVKQELIAYFLVI